MSSLVVSRSPGRLARDDHAAVYPARGEWVASIGLDASKFGTHSLRRTKAVLIYRWTGNLRGPNSCSGTRRSRATFATSASRSMTPSKSRRRSTSDIHGAESGGAACPNDELGRYDTHKAGKYGRSSFKSRHPIHSVPQDRRGVPRCRLLYIRVTPPADDLSGISRCLRLRGLLPAPFRPTARLP